jgi:hypothetical protein
MKAWYKFDKKISYLHARDLNFYYQRLMMEFNHLLMESNKNWFKFKTIFQWQYLFKIQYFPHIRSKNYKVTSKKSFSQKVLIR